MEASVAATTKMLDEKKLTKVVVTAPFYQLPRIKLCCQRAGLDVHTVPSAKRCACRSCDLSLVHEVVAFWLSYLQPFLM